MAEINTAFFWVMKPLSAVVSEETVSVIRDETQLGIALHNHNLCTCGWVVNTTPPVLYPRKEIHFPLCRWLGGPQDQPGLAWKNLTPSGVQTKTTHP